MSRGSRCRPHSNTCLSSCFQNIHAAPIASTTHVSALTTTRSVNAGRLSISVDRLRDEPNVDPDSLRNTLEAHRAANRASLIVKIVGKGSRRQPIVVPSLIGRDERPEKLWGSRARSPRVPSATAKTRSKNKQLREGESGTQLLAQWNPSPETRSSEMYPWMKYMKQSPGTEPEGRLTGVEQLDREIDAFFSYSQASPQEERAAEQALRDISMAIAEIDSELKVDIVGSRATGLHSPLSDIDINVSTSTPRTSKTSAVKILKRIAEHLLSPANNRGRFRSVVCLSRPRVPILTVRHAPTYLEVQVQSTVDVFLSKEQAMTYVNEFPTLQRLFLVLKQMLGMRGLNRGTNGGLTSYPLLVMIVAALKFSEGKFDRRDAGGQLLFFLDMYSDIDFNQTAISFFPLQYIVKRHPHISVMPQARSAARALENKLQESVDSGLAVQDIDARRSFATLQPAAEFLMCLQDPANVQKDLGRAAFRIREIQTTFIHIREKLKSDLKQWEDWDVSSEQSPLLASCVGGDHRILEDLRNDLRESVMQK